MKSTMFKGKITRTAIETFKTFCEFWMKETKKRHLHLPPGYVAPSITIILMHLAAAAKQEVKKTELQHKIEKAYEVKLKAPATTGSLDDFLSDTQTLIKSNWHIIAIVILAYLLFYHVKYIIGVNTKLDLLEKQMQLLVANGRFNNKTS